MPQQFYRRDLRKLVRKLVVSARPEREQSLLVLLFLSSGEDQDTDYNAAIAAAGAIPPLVQLMGPSLPADVQEKAAGILTNIAQNEDTVVAIAAAGAIPPLVQLLGLGSSPAV
ncbi:hypothetical protein FOA52_008713 [Chlamydomonas sp. UWO 241]|nr:hypothetical protein FOA52_008713 [Chlamydomonas sp. UWO 241]